jgi:hypothetical protein
VSFLTVFTFMILGIVAWESVKKAFVVWLLGGGK